MLNEIIKIFKFLAAGPLAKTNLNFNLGQIGYPLSALGKLKWFPYLVAI